MAWVGIFLPKGGYMEPIFEEELKDFVRCMAARGYNPNTQVEYAANAARFFNWLGRRESRT